jgi:hypothetical protein
MIRSFWGSQLLIAQIEDTDHVDKVLAIKKDVQFETHVTGVDYDVAFGK